MIVRSVYLDDIAVYNALAFEYGEDGEIVDVHCPAMPRHLVGQIGKLVQVKLAYEEGEVLRSGWMRFLSLLESLDMDGSTVMRFVWDATYYGEE